MNVTQGTDTQHKTGILEREEQDSHALGTGDLSFIIHPPVTGKLNTTGETSEMLDVDSDYFQAIIDLTAPEILIQTEIALLKKQFITECRNMFMEANASSNNELNIIIQIFSSFANTAPIDNGSKTFREDLEKYFIDSKLRIQTFAEYLHLVKGIDRHKLKAVIANYCLIYKTTFKSFFQSERILSTELLGVINNFLPELIADLKDKNNLEQFTNDFVNLLSVTISKKEVIFEKLLEDDNFSQIIETFSKTYLNTELNKFIRMLKSIYEYSKYWTEEQISEFLNLIKYLNSPNYIGRSLDSFINELSRTIRLNYLTAINPTLQESFHFEIRDIHNESRRSIYPTIEATENSMDIRRVLKKIPPENFARLHLNIYSSIQKGGAAEGRSPKTAQEVLNSIMLREPIQIEDPLELVNYFFRLFEDSILEFEETIFNETGKTIPSSVISTLCFQWIEEIRDWFNTSANLVTPRKLDNFFFYVLKSMGKSDEEIRNYVELRSSPSSQDPNVYAEITWKATPIINEKVEDLRRKITARYSIQQVDFERTSEPYKYYQDVIEMLSNLVRTEVRKDNIYYADSAEQVFEDLSIGRIEDKNKMKFVEHILRNLPMSSKYIKIIGGQIQSSLNKELMADKIIEIFNVGSGMITTLIKALNVQEDESLKEKIVDFFTDPAKYTL